MENIGLGLQLMLVGMVTVFAILIIVINFSKLLIVIINKVAPEEATTVKKQPASSTTIDSNTMSIIQAAVASITGGKGTVSKVETI